MRYMITDGLWAAMEPLVNQAKKHKTVKLYPVLGHDFG